MTLYMANITVSKNLEPSPSVLLPLHGGSQREKTKAKDLGRRGLLLSVMFASSTTLTAQAEDSKTALLQKYLKKSEENKVKNDKERQDDYYRRNYKDYFEFVQGGLEAKSEDQLTEAEKGIIEWLKTHK